MTTSVLTATSASVQNWSLPAGVGAGSVITGELWGAGTGGSGSSTSFRAGGAAGAWTTSTYTVTTADVVTGSIPYLLPAGSAGTGAANAVAAADTWFPWSKNLCTNITMAGASTGAVASTGTGSPLPTGWFIQGASGSAWSASGLTCTVIGSGADDGSGRPYIDLQFTGTAATTAINIYTEAVEGTAGNVQAPITPSVAYNASYFVSFTAGALTNVAGAAARFDTTTYTSTTTAYSATISGTSTQMTSSPVVRTVTGTPGVTTQGAIAYAVITITTAAQIGGSASGITIRFAGFQLEAGSSATAYQTPASGRLMAKGALGNSGTTGGVGALAYACLPKAAAFTGGSGATRTQGGGGGGAAGPAGAGASSTTGTGGTADNGSGGAAGVSNVEGGGGASAAVSPSAAGDPGGGGGASTSTNAGSAGGRGQIRLTYAQQPFTRWPPLLPIMAQ